MKLVNEKELVTDQRTDGQPSYRDGWTHLKSVIYRHVEGAVFTLLFIGEICYYRVDIPFAAFFASRVTGLNAESVILTSAISSFNRFMYEGQPDG